MNLICKLFGHKWREIPSRQYVKMEGVVVDCIVDESVCDRCRKTMQHSVMPIGATIKAGFVREPHE